MAFGLLELRYKLVTGTRQTDQQEAWLHVHVGLH